MKKCGINDREEINLMESTEVSSLGLGRRPDNNTIISNDHISMLSPNKFRVMIKRIVIIIDGKRKIDELVSKLLT